MTIECSNTISYNNCNNICTLKQHNTSIKLIEDRPIDRQTNIATYRAAIAAKNAKNDYRMF